MKLPRKNKCVKIKGLNNGFFGIRPRRSPSKMTRRMSSYDPRSFQSNRSGWVWRWKDKVRKTRWLVRRNNGASLSGAQKTVSPASNRVDLRPRCRERCPVMIQGVFNPIGVGGYGDGGIRCAKRVGWCVEIKARDSSMVNPRGLPSE